MNGRRCCVGMKTRFLAIFSKLKREGGNSGDQVDV